MGEACYNNIRGVAFSRSQAVTPPKPTWGRALHGLMSEVLSFAEKEATCTGTGPLPAGKYYLGSDTVFSFGKHDG